MILSKEETALKAKPFQFDNLDLEDYATELSIQKFDTHTNVFNVMRDIEEELGISPTHPRNIDISTYIEIWIKIVALKAKLALVTKK